MSVTAKKLPRFIPYRLFVGAFIPNCLLQYPGISDSAKILWGRLAQYAGKDGSCYPSHSCLAEELAKKPRQVRNLIAELIAKGFLEREAPTPKERGQGKTTRYFFLQHPVFGMGRPHPEPDGGQHVVADDTPPRGVDDPTLQQFDSLEVGQSIAVPYGNSLPQPTAINCRTLGQEIASKENQLREKEKTQQPHTDQAVEPQDERPGQGRGGGGISASLSEEAKRYIELKVAYQACMGKLDMPGAYRSKLERLAMKGELDLSDLGVLTTWDDENRRLAGLELEQAKQAEAITQVLADLVNQHGAHRVAMTLVWKLKDHNINERLAGIDQDMALKMLKADYPDEYLGAESFDWDAHRELKKRQAIEETKGKITAYMASHPEWTPKRIFRDMAPDGECGFPAIEFGEHFREALDGLFPDLAKEVREAWHQRMREKFAFARRRTSNE